MPSITIDRIARKNHVSKERVVDILIQLIREGQEPMDFPTARKMFTEDVPVFEDAAAVVARRLQGA